jgi:hypothetical protein
MKKVCAKVVLKNSTNGQLVDSCTGEWKLALMFCNILKRIMGLNRVIIEDKIWGFQHNPESARQGMQWKSPGSLIPKCMEVKKLGHCWFISLTAKV